jgi:hypothetical protein
MMTRSSKRSTHSWTTDMVFKTQNLIVWAVDGSISLIDKINNSVYLLSLYIIFWMKG